MKFHVARRNSAAEILAEPRQKAQGKPSTIALFIESTASFRARSRGKYDCFREFKAAGQRALGKRCAASGPSVRVNGPLAGASEKQMCRFEMKLMGSSRSRWLEKVRDNGGVVIDLGSSRVRTCFIRISSGSLIRSCLFTCLGQRYSRSSMIYILHVMKVRVVHISVGMSAARR